MWRLLHAAAHNLARKGAPTHNLQRLVNQLPRVMPCSLCRESFQTILASAQAGVGGPAWTASHTPIDVVMWDLHNRVNTKLGRTGGPDIASVRVVLRARRAARQPYPWPDDVWFMLYIFAGCADALRMAPETAQRRDCPLRQWHLCKFIAYLRRTLLDAGLLPEVAAALAAVRWDQDECRTVHAMQRIADAARVPLEVPLAVIREVRVAAGDSQEHGDQGGGRRASAPQ